MGQLKPSVPRALSQSPKPVMWRVAADADADAGAGQVCTLLVVDMDSHADVGPWCVLMMMMMMTVIIITIMSWLRLIPLIISNITATSSIITPDLLLLLL